MSIPTKTEFVMSILSKIHKPPHRLHRRQRPPPPPKPSLTPRLHGSMDHTLQDQPQPCSLRRSLHRRRHSLPVPFFPNPAGEPTHAALLLSLKASFYCYPSTKDLIFAVSGLGAMAGSVCECNFLRRGPGAGDW